MPESDPWDAQPFRIVIEGVVPDTFLPTLLDGIRNITPVNGGFTFSVGTHTNHANRSQEES